MTVFVAWEEVGRYRIRFAGEERFLGVYVSDVRAPDGDVLFELQGACERVAPFLKPIKVEKWDGCEWVQQIFATSRPPTFVSASASPESLLAPQVWP